MFEKWFHINIFSCSKKVLVSMMFSSKNSIKFAWKKSETLLELVLTILEYHHNKKDKKTSIIDVWQGRKYASDADETFVGNKATNRVNLKTGVSRKQSTRNFPKNDHLLLPDMHNRQLVRRVSADV